ncbi:MAG: hypothetical protein QOD06_1642 [Candidatus Binatota bacterium]|nr:hypothetical protein [Candidatus Binatota bacterium]
MIGGGQSSCARPERWPWWVAIVAGGVLLGSGARAADYVHADREAASRPAATRAAESDGAARCIDCGERADYRSLDGTLYSLTEFDGRHVALLLSDEWLAGLSREERRALVDRADLLYQHYSEVVGGEPEDDGLLRIAIVEHTCGGAAACGVVSGKRIEIDDEALESVRASVAAGFVPYLLLHEMAHNFDLYWNLLHYLPDHAHAWTEFVSTLVVTYGRSHGFRAVAPEDFQRLEIEQTYLPYLEDPDANWQRCVRDGACEATVGSANAIWAAVTQRVAQLHGVEAIRRSMAFLREYAGGGGSESDAEAIEDLHVEALAAGVGRNLSCYADAWKWQASTALRQRMAERYGSVNPDCEDRDGDGTSPLAGDCDDAEPTVHPGAAETRNGVDDDCNLAVDDLAIVETDGDGAAGSAAIPFQATGKITDAGDRDAFELQGGAAAAVRFRFCSRSTFAGYLSLASADGSVQDVVGSVTAGRCDYQVRALDGPGPWTLTVSVAADDGAGAYSIEAAEAPLRWGAVSAPTCDDGRLHFEARTDRLVDFLPRPTEVRFWVSGLGFVGAAPFSPTASFDWRPPGSLAAGALGVRVQLYAGATPVSSPTEPRWLDWAPAGVSPGTEDVDAQGGERDIVVEAPGFCHWTASASEPWIELISAAEGDGDGVVRYRVVPNDRTTARRGSLLVQGSTVAVSQEGTGSPEPAPTPTPDRQPPARRTPAETATRCGGRFVTIPAGGPGSDRIEGTPGDDVIHGGGGADTIQGNGGNDRICGGGGDDEILGNGGDDTLLGGGGRDVLDGGGGDDVLKGGGRDDRLLGGDGDDRLIGNAGEDRCDGGSGRDRESTCER